VLDESIDTLYKIWYTSGKIKLRRRKRCAALVARMREKKRAYGV